MIINNTGRHYPNNHGASSGWPCHCDLPAGPLRLVLAGRRAATGTGTSYGTVTVLMSMGTGSGCSGWRGRLGTCVLVRPVPVGTSGRARADGAHCSPRAEPGPPGPGRCGESESGIVHNMADGVPLGGYHRDSHTGKARPTLSHLTLAP